MPHLARAATTLLMLAAWLASGPSATADPPAASEVNLGAVVDKAVKPFLERKKAVGLVVGVVRDGKTDVFGRGRVAPDSDRVPDGSTLYEIGSISKVFTSLALAAMVGEGAVKLDDPVRTLLPGDWKVPRRGDREITLADLATHTSGLPRVPPAVIFRAIFNDDPYAAFDDRALRQFLSAHTLRRDPGSKFEYSNLGAGLLGYALALKAGGDYEALIASKVTGPLGMTSTRVVPGPALEPRLAKGYKAGGVPTASWRLDTLAGAGALKSSVDDMLRFLDAQLGHAPSSLAPAIAMARQPRVDADAKGTRIGLGWLLRTSKDGRTRIWHNGGTGGYRSFAAFDPDARIGVVVLANTDAEVDTIGAEVFLALLPAPPPKPEAAPR